MSKLLTKELIIKGFKAASKPLFVDGKWRSPVLGRRQLAESLKLFGSDLVPLPAPSQFMPHPSKRRIHEKRKLEK